MMNQPKVIIRTQYSDTYKNIAVSAFFAHVSDKGFEITAYVDEDDFTPGEVPQANTVYIRRTLETRLTIPPMQMKALHDLIGKQLKDYEDIFGKIPTPEELQEKVVEKRKNVKQSASSGTTSTKGTVGIG